LSEHHPQSASAASSSPDDLDLYLDGQLSPEQAAAFERRMMASPALRAEVNAARAIDNNLRTLFVVPQDIATPHTSQQTLPFWRRRWFAAAAAVLLLVTAYAVSPWSRLMPASAPAQIYFAQHDKGFVPEVVCTTPEAFAQWTNAQFKEELTPATLPESIQLVGWSKTKLISDYTGILLAKVDGKEVIVLMDSTMYTKEVPDTYMHGLHTFETTMGKVRLIEVTPFNTPRITPYILTKDQCGTK
jgi:hypothetical protein